jgi:hypothetical protein
MDLDVCAPTGVEAGDCFRAHLRVWVFVAW